MDSIAKILADKNIPHSENQRPERQNEVISVPYVKPKGEMESLTLKQLLSQSYPDSEWVVDRLIPEGLTVLSAQPASFKTWLLLEIALRVANGDMLLDTFETKQSGVLIIDEENSPRLLQQRLNLLDKNDELPIHFMIEQDFKLDDKKVSKIIKFCRENNIGFVTFDSLVRIHDSNENDAVQMAGVFAQARKFTKAGISILITHHNRKNGKGEAGSQDMRGSSDILASVDCHLTMKRERNQKRLYITQTKVRTAEELPTIELEVETTNESVRLKYIGTAEPIETKRDKTIRLIIELLTEHSQLNQKELLNELEAMHSKVNAKTLRDILRRLIEERQVKVSSGKGNEQIYNLNR